MKLIESMELLPLDNPQRLRRWVWGEQTGRAYRIGVDALGDLKVEIGEGRYAGRVIEAFAWIEVPADQPPIVNVTEHSTGRRLAHFPILQSGGDIFALDDAAFQQLSVPLLQAAMVAGFEPFRRADDERVAGLLARMEQLPAVATLPALENHETGGEA